MQIMHRWYVFTLLLLKEQPAHTGMLLFILHGLPPLLLTALFALTPSLMTPAAWIALVVLLAVRALIITHTLRCFSGRYLHHLLLSIFSEFLQPVHLLHAVLCRTIHWRTRHYRVRNTREFIEI